MTEAELAATGLGLFSAVTLAAANLSVKLGSDILAARAMLSVSAALLIAPAAFFVPAPDAAVWSALVFAVPAHFAYQLCLIAALQRGELSLVFPVMRGGAPLMTGLLAAVVLGETLSVWAYAGLVIATVAVVSFALPPRGVALRRHPDRAALGWALATSLGVALYNVADARGVRTAPAPETFIVWLFLVDWICVSITTVLLRRGQLVEAVRLRWRYGVAAGALSILSFGAALYAMSLVEAAKVAALRETAVVFGALFGAMILKEGFGRRRIAAAAVLAGGLALMQWAG